MSTCTRTTRQQRKRSDLGGYVTWMRTHTTVQERLATECAEDNVSIAAKVARGAQHAITTLPAASRATVFLQDQELFLSPAGIAYVCLPSLIGVDDATPYLAVPIRSRATVEHLHAASAALGTRALGRPAIESAQQNLTALARELGVVKEVSVRRWVDTDTPDGIPVLWVDVGDGGGAPDGDLFSIWGRRDETVEAATGPQSFHDADEDDEDGEEDDPSVRGYDSHRWYRPDGFLPLPADYDAYDDLLDVADSDLPNFMEELRPYVNAEDDAALLKMVAWLIGTWHPSGGPYKLLYLCGPTGVAKTMTARHLASLVDPRNGMVNSKFPKDAAEVKRRAEQQGVLVFDDLTAAPVWFQQTLSQLAAGYYDERAGAGDIRYCRPMLATGLDYLFTRPDLRARTYVAELRPFPAGRLPDELVDARWKTGRPRLQALLWRVVATGLARYPAVLATYQTPDRFASAEAWLAACEPATGLPEGTFHRLMVACLEQAPADTPQAPGPSELRTLLLLLREAPDHTWTGTGDQLATDLASVAEQHGVPAPASYAGALMRALRRQTDEVPRVQGLTWTTRHSGKTVHTFTRAP